MQLSIFDTASPMDFSCYGADPTFFARLKPFVSEAAHIRYQMRVETALAELLSEHGVAPPSFGEAVARACERISAEDVHREEARTRHGVRALVNCIRRELDGTLRPFVHLFATSNDIIDSATALQLKELVRDVVVPDLVVLMRILIRRAREHATTLQIGRTHGQYAEPITFGYFLANYIVRLGDRTETIERAARNLRGKFSGAVGSYSALRLRFENATEIEALVLRKLGLRPIDAQVSTQIVHPEHVTDLAHAVVTAFSVIANLADDVRSLHRSEIGELRESYDAGRVGSSTMPQKVNPKSFEFVKSMWKACMPRMATVYMDQISEHQRDLTNVPSSRFVTELMTGFVYSVGHLAKAMDTLEVLESGLRHHVERAEDEAIAEPLYILLSLHGHEDGHTVVRRLVAEARAAGTSLAARVAADRELVPLLAELGPAERRAITRFEDYTGLCAERTYATCERGEEYCAEAMRRLAEWATTPGDKG